jgi:integrase
MATIEKRVRNGKTTYRVRYRDPGGGQRSKVFARKADAQRFLNETETAKARGTWTDPSLGKVLFRDWLGEWWATTTNLRPKTRDRDELLLRRLALPSFGAVPLAAISQRDVRAWVAELSARGLAPATVQKSYQLLGKVMGAAVDAGMLAQSPCRRVPLPKVEREEMRFLTPAEVATLADAIAPRCRALVLVGAYGGLRIGELAGLRRSRVDLLRGTVTVAEIVVEVRGVLHIGPPKTRASRRTVGLPRFVVEELAAHLAGPGDPEAFVFTAPQGGPLRVTAFRARVWRPATRAAGLDGLRIHDRRRPVDRSRGQPQGGRGSRRTRLGELHPGPLRPPVPGGRRCPPRPLGRALRQHPAGTGTPGDSPARATRAWPQRGPRRLRQRQERRRW